MCKYFVTMASLMVLAFGLISCTIHETPEVNANYPVQYLGDNVYQVRYKSTSDYDLETLKFRATKRAARLVVSQNQQFFEILSVLDATRQYESLTPPSNVPSGLYNEDTSLPVIHTYGGSIVTHLRQEIILTIKIVPQATPVSYDAKAVLAEQVL